MSDMFFRCARNLFAFVVQPYHIYILLLLLIVFLRYDVCVYRASFVCCFFFLVSCCVPYNNNIIICQLLILCR